MATAADVPGRYDCVINGTGYLFYDQIDESLPFRTAKAIYSYSPTFVERSNTQGNFGDNQQDFWLTASQNDWTEGEEQKFYRASDADSRRAFFRGSAVDLQVPGQVTIQNALVSADFGVGISVYAACGGPALGSALLFAASTTNLYEVSGTGGVTDRGAHGAGSPNMFSICSDYTAGRIFVGGQTKVRKYDTSAHTFADFSATAVGALAYHNNALYGMTSSQSALLRFDTAGTATTVFTWQDAIGTGTGYQAPLVSWGPKLLILRQQSAGGGELWLYDGVGVNRIAQFPPNFLPYGIDTQSGVVFVGGAFVTENFTKYQSALWAYANGTLSLVWKAGAPATNTSAPAVCAFRDGVVFTDETEGRYLFYSLPDGSVSTLGTFTAGNKFNATWMAGNGSSFLHVRNQRNNDFFPSTSKATTATVSTSLFDFDSSLDKYVKAVKVDFDAASDGNGGSVDVSYKLNGVTNSSDTYTSVQVGATAGTEYTIGQSCRSISIKVTLNKGTSTLGPVLKRIYVRAAPVLQQFPLRQYTIACFGDPTEQVQTLRDGTSNPKSGRELADALITAVSATTPISITDRFGTYTGDLQPENFELHEIHANPLTPPNKSGSFVAKVGVRGV